MDKLKKNVVIVAPSDDIHAIAVKNRILQVYNNSINCTIFDSATYPIATSISWLHQDDHFDIMLQISPALASSIGSNTGKLLSKRKKSLIQPISFESISGIWLRRPRRLIIHPSVTDSEFQSFCYNVSKSSFFSFLNSCTVHNHADINDSGTGKPFQLHLAKMCGLKIPSTLITNDPDAARNYITKLWQENTVVVYKHVASAVTIGLPTRIVKNNDLNRLRTLKYAPAIFQERITGGPDLRIVVIGQHIFVAEWRTKSNSQEIPDIRFANDVRLHPVSCPKTIQSPLLKFHRRLGLTFGVYDFKLNHNGEPFFLEVNPEGQWLDLEIEAKYPISEVLSRVLVEGLGKKYKTEYDPYTNDELTKLAEEKQLGREPDNWRPVI